MQNPDKLFGRLSNRMFQMAAHLSWCWDNDVHFFVQDEKYFKKYEAQIKQLYGDGIDQRNKGYVGIHVRRAKNPINPDEPAYSENPFYANLMHHLHEDMSDNYYVQAMNYFKKLDPNLKFKIFSDDIDWCLKQEIFKGCVFSGYAYVTGTVMEDPAVRDLNDLASCEHQIIANSSFSWWAAWLNPNPNKIVVAPKQWFANPEHDKQFIGIPNTWLRL